MSTIRDAASLEEMLSALMDGETDDLELRRLLKQLPDSERRQELLDTWQRFHLAQAALHGERVNLPSPAVTARILAAIDAEPAYEGANAPLPAGSAGAHKQVRHSEEGRRWYAQAGKLAIAASVTLTVFLGMQVLLTQDESAQTGAGSMLAGSDAGSVAPVERSDSVDPEAQRRLNEYIQTVSIQYQGDQAEPISNLYEEIPLLRPVNLIELEPLTVPESNQ